MQTKFKAALLAGVMFLSGSGAAMAENFGLWLVTFSRQKEVKPVTDKTYEEECGSCHFAYPPGLLTSKSWEKLLNEKALADHFGENAELDKDTLTTVYDYALANAADQSYFKRSRKIALASEGVDPIRITEVRYIKRKHQDIPAKAIKGNKDVKSLSYCNACHTKAKEGIFDEDTVDVPNFPDRDFD